MSSVVIDAPLGCHFSLIGRNCNDFENRNPEIQSTFEVGARLRLRRKMLGLSQEKLGRAIGLTFQQVQKYERGANRIGASRLHELSRLLEVPVSFFFDDTDPVRAPAMGGFTEPSTEAFEADPLRAPEMLELVYAYLAIEDSTVRQRLLDHPASRTSCLNPREEPACSSGSMA